MDNTKQKETLDLGEALSTVNVRGASQDVFVPVAGTDSRLKIGTVVTETFETKGVLKHHFISNGAVGGKEKIYSLGPTTDSFQFIGHDAALSPLLQEGYEITRAVYSRGGMSAIFQLTHPEGRELLDPIVWDSGIWPETDVHGKKLPKVLKESLVVGTSIKPGKGLMYRRGLLRMVCTNGLMAEILGMGSAHYSHTNWTLDGVRTTILNNEWGLPTDETVRGPFIGRGIGVQRLLPTITRLAHGDQLSQDLMSEMPAFLQNLFSPITNMPGWFVEGLAQQFEAMVNHFGQNEKIYALDILNAITSPASIELKTESPRQVSKVYTRIDSLTQAVSNLVGSLSL